MRYLPSQGHPMLQWFPQTVSNIRNTPLHGEPGDFRAKRRPSRAIIPSFRGWRKSVVTCLGVGKPLIVMLNYFLHKLLSIWTQLLCGGVTSLFVFYLCLLIHKKYQLTCFICHKLNGCVQNHSSLTTICYIVSLLLSKCMVGSIIPSWLKLSNNTLWKQVYHWRSLNKHIPSCIALKTKWQIDEKRESSAT